MGLRKFGTGEILPDDEVVQKTAASTQDKEQVLAEVVQEQQQVDSEEQE